MKMATTTLGPHKLETNIALEPMSPRSSLSSQSPPNYYENSDIIELGALTPATTASSTSLPKYEALGLEEVSGASSQADFQVTRALQIEAVGHRLISLPVPPRPFPINVYEILPEGTVGSQTYTSLRASRCSGNSILIRADDESQTPLCSTTYRFGPGRSPRIKLHGATTPSAGSDLSAASPAHEEEFEVRDRGYTTRAQVIRTHLGTFMWRYADRDERRAHGADSLLVLEKLTAVALEGGKQEERRRRVAQLVRNKEFRSVHTSRSTAGNGGRLMIDLREWIDEKGAAEQMEALTVASCLVMLKKEVDRRRACQAMVLAGAAGS
ncbi:hypothetical protein HJFPF1_06429 [Paramyrothecium foliicola]|nr:hypothetical protein HJFPF1_06429 [Paramyrothecium foliicola]